MKPVLPRSNQTVTVHHGDEFDEEVSMTGHLCVIPIRDYTPKVPQTFDEFVTPVEADDMVGPFNQMGPVIDGAIPVVTTKSFESYMAAFDKRSNSQPDADDDCSPEFMKQALSLWDALPVTFEPFDVDETTFMRWLFKLDPPKQQRMLKALDDLFDCEDDARYLGEKTLSVKIEALLKRLDSKWAPRLIYAGNDYFNVLTGPVAMILCEKLVEIFSLTRLGGLELKLAYKCKDTELTEHLLFDKYGDRRPEGYGAEGDFSANDLRQRRGATVVFDKFCEKVGAPSWFRKLLLDMRCFKTKNNEYGHQAELMNQLPTGTTVTTPRNSVWNSTIEAVYMMIIKAEGVGVVLGDDFYAIVNKLVNCDHWSRWVSEHPKMKLTGCTPRTSGEATFLSRRLCVETESHCMMPKLGKALARFNVRVSRQEGISDSAYMAGKALSYAYEFRHFATLRDIFLTRYRLEEDRANVTVNEVSWFTRTSGVDLDSLESAIRNEPVLVSEDETREFLMDAYGDTFGLVDAYGIARRVVLSRDISIIDAPFELSVDWS